MKKLISIITILLVCSCSQTGKTTGSGRPFEVLFGRTGGFTNVTVEFVIKSNRELFRIQNGETVRLDKMSKEKFKEIKNRIDSVDFKNLSSQEPGNINYFIEVRHPDYENRVQWSNPTGENPLNTLYQLLLSSLKQ